MAKLEARTTVTSRLSLDRTLPVGNTSLSVTELPLHGIIRVQADGGAPHTRAAMKSALGLELPRAERSTKQGTTWLVWVGPDEWLVLCSLEDEAALLETLSEKLASLFATVTLTSDSRVSFNVSGNVAADFLAKGCSIDLDDTVFPEGAAVTTRFAGLPAMLLRKKGSQYILYFDVSMAGFLVEWLADAAEEFKA